MKRKTKNGFTLVELLAVIVILAIILVIAVPKVMSVIEDSKKATLESTAKMIASAAEKQKVQNTVLGKGDAITCDSVAKINKGDYASCSIIFDDNTAKVTIEGKGKFKGLNVCSGTKTSASATKDECALVCDASEIAIEKVEYEVKDYDSCVSYLTNIYISFGAPQEFIDSAIPSLCSGNGFNGYSTSDFFIGEIEEWGVYTEQDLIENNVIKVTIEEECLELTPEQCFAFDSENGAITGYDETCGTDVVIPSQINGKNVVSISRRAFCGRWITSVYLPNTIEYIGRSAFEDNYISVIEIPSSVTTIDRYAFQRNPLKNVKINNLDAEIVCKAFGDPGTIKTHNLPDDYGSNCPPE